MQLFVNPNYFIDLSSFYYRLDPFPNWYSIVSSYWACILWANIYSLIPFTNTLNGISGSIDNCKFKFAYYRFTTTLTLIAWG